MAHQTGTGPPRFLKGELDPNVAALVAVVQDSHGPGQLRSIRIIGRVIIEAVVGELFHGMRVGWRAWTCQKG